jgi:hypothetical protein
MKAVSHWTSAKVIQNQALALAGSLYLYGESFILTV